MFNRVFLTTFTAFATVVPLVASATTYSEPPGQYLRYENGQITQHVECPADHYCPGVYDETFNNASMGIYSCSSVDPTYAYSDAGSHDGTQCYYTDTVNCEQFYRDIALWSGNNLYDELFAITPTFANTDATIRYYNGGYTGFEPVGACAVIDLDCDAWEGPGGIPNGNGPLANYMFEGVYTNDGPNVRYRETGGYGYNDTGLSDGEWEFSWPDGTLLHGRVSCNNLPGNYGDEVPHGDITAGENSDYNCWCTVDGYTLASDGTSGENPESQWVYLYYDRDNGNCQSNCALECMATIGWGSNDYDMKRRLIGNEWAYISDDCGYDINVTWYNQSTVVDTDTCSLGGTISVPNAPTRTGYTFNGWTVF